MDSSPDLSLKLRRGSNDSRDSYYMDFAQGIDSDIEEVATVAAAPGNTDEASDSSDSPAVAVPLPVTDDIDNDDIEEPELIIDDECLPPTPPPPPVLESIPTIPSMPTISTIPNISTTTLTSSAMASLTDSSTTDEEDISQITPLPMPILPPLKTDMLQMLPTKPLVDDDEG